MKDYLLKKGHQTSNRNAECASIELDSVAKGKKIEKPEKTC